MAEGMNGVKKSVAVLLFPGVELLDFAGPFEVFSAARPTANSDVRLMDVWTVAESLDPVQCNNPLRVLPDYDLLTCPHADVLVIPGGMGTRTAVNRPELIGWLAERSQHADVTTSVCTGSFLLAQAGLLDGRSATTHFGSVERMRQTYANINVREAVRWVDEWPIVTSAGVSAGIDMALYVLSRLYGSEVADVTARHIEYDYWPHSD